VGEKRNAYREQVRMPEGRRPFERPRRRWKDSTKEIVWEGVYLIFLAQGGIL
jgi:hypothetical protein